MALVGREVHLARRIQRAQPGPERVRGHVIPAQPRALDELALVRHGPVRIRAQVGITDLVPRATLGELLGVTFELERILVEALHHGAAPFHSGEPAGVGGNPGVFDCAQGARRFATDVTDAQPLLAVATDGQVEKAFLVAEEHRITVTNLVAARVESCHLHGFPAVGGYLEARATRGGRKYNGSVPRP